MTVNDGIRTFESKIMCGRIYIQPSKSLDDLLSGLGVSGVELPTRYNVAPTNEVPVIFGSENERKMVDMAWWLHPSWSPHDPKSREAHKYPTFNAKIETVATLRSFNNAIRKQRAIVPGYAFVEWQKGTADPKQKIPYLIKGVDQPLAFAAMYDVWHDSYFSCAIVTQEPDEYFSKIHDRMPLTLTVERCKRWLDPRENVEDLLKDFWGATIKLWEQEVDPVINNARNKVPAVPVAH